MSSHQLNTNKSRSLKCHHFKFELHHCCPTCREAGKGGGPCVTQEGQCSVCSSFTEDQKFKIKNRKRYVRKSIKLVSSQDESDLLGDVKGDKVFSGSHEELENTVQQLYASPPQPQQLRFNSLSLKTLQNIPKTIPPTPGTSFRCLSSHPHAPKLKEIPHNSQVFQFTSLPFSLATAPQVFTMILKEVKLMAVSRGIRLHQYLDDWLIKALS